MSTLLAVLALGFFLGMRHATDPDHVIAVSTIVARNRSTVGAALVGAVFLRVLGGVGFTAWGRSVPWPLLVGVFAEEIVFRRVLQGALERRAGEGGRHRAMGVAFAIGVAAALGPLTPELVAQQAIASALRARTGRVLPGLVARVLALV